MAEKQIQGPFDFSLRFNKDDPRLGDIIKQGDVGDIVIVGFPHDEGVKRNGGRVGAAKAPAKFREFIPKIGTIVNLEYNADLRPLKIVDSGDINPHLDLEKAHNELRMRVTQIIRSGGIPFVVGGGNDQSYPNACGMIDAIGRNAQFGVVNIDAHLDVRPLKEGKAHSGSPFRQLLTDEERWVRKGNTFVEFSAQGNQCSAEHWEWVLRQPGGSIIPYSSLRDPATNVAMKWAETLEKLGNNAFVSFDIDSIQSSDCPGVSAPANFGLTADEACKMCLMAGESADVKLFDMSELNPLIEDYRTPRLAVLMFYFFAMGVARRKAAAKK